MSTVVVDKLVTILGFKVENEVLRKLLKELEHFKSVALETAKSTRKIKEEIKAVGASTGIGRAFQSLKKAIGPIKAVRKELKKLRNQAKDAGDVAKRLRDGFLQFQGIKLLVNGLQSVVGGVFDTLRSFESLKASLATVTGSTENADKAFARIKKAAKDLPFSVEQITTAFVRLKGLGIEPTEEVIESIANTASATQKTFIQFTEAIADAVTGEFERLKEFGIKASVNGDRVALTFRNQTTEIDNTSAAIKEFLIKQVGLKSFGGAAAGQMSTLNGIISNLKDNLQAFAETMGAAGLLDALKELGIFVRDTVGDGGDLAEVIGQALAAAVRNVTAMFRRLTSADVGRFIKTLISTFGDLVKTAGILAKIFMLLSDTFGGPGGLISMFIAGKTAMLGFDAAQRLTSDGSRMLGSSLRMGGVAMAAFAVSMAGAQLIMNGFRSDMAKLRAESSHELGASMSKDIAKRFAGASGQSIHDQILNLDDKVEEAEADREIEIGKFDQSFVSIRAQRFTGKITGEESRTLFLGKTFSSPEELVSTSAIDSLKAQRAILQTEHDRREALSQKEHERKQASRAAGMQQLEDLHQIKALLEKHRTGKLSKRERDRLRRLQQGQNALRFRAGQEQLDVIGDGSKKKGKGPDDSAFRSNVESVVAKQVSLASIEAGRLAIASGESIESAEKIARQAAQRARKETLSGIESGRIAIGDPDSNESAWETKLNAEVEKQMHEAEIDAGQIALSQGLGFEAARAAAIRAGKATKQAWKRKMQDTAFRQTPEMATLLRQAGLTESARHVTPPIISINIVRNEVSIRVDAPSITGPFSGTAADNGKAVARQLKDLLASEYKKAMDALSTPEVR